jgi:LysR family transcriptional regulator for metE and metH
MQYLELKHLKMVRAIAETANLTRAAGQLCLSQSALSQQLRDIETKLGADLFFRTRKQMVLTPIGRKVLAAAEQVCRLMEETELEIAKEVHGERGVLRIGVQCLFCYKWLPSAVRAFRKVYPRVDLHIGAAEELAAELENSRHDLVVTAAPADDGRLQYQPLFADQMVCVLPPEHPLAGQSWIEAADFQKYSLISHADRSRNRFYQMMLRPLGIEPKQFLTVAQPQAMMELVAAGLGIAIFPAWAIDESAREGRVISRPLTEQGIPLTWHGVTLPAEQPPVYQTEFLRIIKRMQLGASHQRRNSPLRLAAG